MTTLVDTSAWIAFFRPKGDPQAKRSVAALLHADQAAWTDPVRMELLIGARTSDEDALVRDALRLCIHVPFEAESWETAARLERLLRAKGLLVPRDDVLIAAAAMDHHVPLLCHDRHFEQIRTVFPALRLA